MKDIIDIDENIERSLVLDSLDLETKRTKAKGVVVVESSEGKIDKSYV